MRFLLVSPSMDNIGNLFCLNNRLSYFDVINPTKITNPHVIS